MGGTDRGTEDCASLHELWAAFYFLDARTNQLVKELLRAGSGRLAMDFWLPLSSEKLD